ncbi:hypothetical protein [Marinobacterium rhizophilum]|uniref:hypothetical protein n=1 Tax=Marinobacterium rhizophilum TaxID=420402 RepID=UPI00037DA43B|nr:hypothetical protein [Marinobacterium rhizophilum]
MTTRVLKTSTCPTLTGSSELSYCIGIDEEDTIQFRITNNTGAGQFSKEWIAYKDVKACLPQGSITSVPLRQLFRGKSLNTSGFLLAALLAEHLVAPMTGKRNLYSLCCDNDFRKEMAALDKSGIDLTTNDEEKTARPSTKATKATTPRER